MSADILQRTTWLDKTIGIYVGELIEYDMREGGWSIILKDHLLPDYIIRRFAKMSKEDRHKAIGNLANSYKRQYANVPKDLIERFRHYRILFGEVNELTDDDIFYVRKDAICVKKYCYHTAIDELIEFRERNVWNSYMRIVPQYKEDKQFNPEPIEFYWKESGHVDVKGVSDDALAAHEDGMLRVISTFMKHLYNLDYEEALKYIVRVMDSYKQGLGEGRNVPHPEYYYRRFNSESKYKIIQDGAVMEVDEIGPSLISHCDKAYNYRNILVPMMNLVTK